MDATAKDAVDAALAEKAADDWLTAFSRKSQEALAKRDAEKKILPKPPDEKALVEALARKDHSEYDRMRVEVAETLGIRVGTLDDKVAAIRKKRLEPDQGSAVAVEDIEPWAEPVDGAVLLDEMSTAIMSHIAMKDSEADTVALWCVYSHAYELFPVAPRLGELAGGSWPARARKAAEAASRVHGEQDIKAELIVDIRAIMDANSGVEEWPSAALAESLAKLEGRPWAEFGRSQKPITQNTLARLLRPFSIAPDRIGADNSQARGYCRWQFEEVFAAYTLLPPSHNRPTVKNAMDIEQVEDSQPSSDLQGLTVGKSQKAASLLGSGHFDGCNRGVAPRGGDDHPSGNGQTVWPRAISDSPEDRQEPPPGAVFAKVEIREVWPPGLGPPDDNIFDLNGSTDRRAGNGES